MATFDDLISNLQELEQTIDASRANDLMVIMNDAKALIAARVQNFGEKADGSKFERYSDRGAPVHLMYNKQKPNGSRIGKDVDALKAQYGNYVSHKDVREFYGLPTDVTTTTYTGEMWRNTGVVPAGETDDTATVELKGLTDSAQDKIDWNSARYGNILSLADDEIEIIFAAALERRQQQINKIFQ